MQTKTFYAETVATQFKLPNPTIVFTGPADPQSPNDPPERINIVIPLELVLTMAMNIIGTVKVYSEKIKEDVEAQGNNLGTLMGSIVEAIKDAPQVDPADIVALGGKTPEETIREIMGESNVVPLRQEKSDVKC